jgi:hypothetical protein
MLKSKNWTYTMGLLEFLGYRRISPLHSKLRDPIRFPPMTKVVVKDNKAREIKIS